MWNCIFITHKCVEWVDTRYSYYRWKSLLGYCGNSDRNDIY